MASQPLLQDHDTDIYCHEYIVYHTIKFLTIRELTRLRVVCTWFNTIASDPDRYLTPLGYPHSDDYKFQVNDKVEAIDKKYPSWCCVCTVKSVDYESHTLSVTFDGWSLTYDYATPFSRLWDTVFPIEFTSTLVNYPKEYKGRKPFDWMNYLSETNSRASPRLAWLMYTDTDLYDNEEYKLQVCQKLKRHYT